MKQQAKIGAFSRGLFAVAAVLSLAGLAVYTDGSVETGKKAVTMCTQVLIPSLFPFFAVSNLIIGLGIADALGRVLGPVMRKLFRVNGACAAAFALGIVGGYPVGARTALELFRTGRATKTEAERLLSFCNNSGPAFILGIIGTGIFSSGKAGFLLYLAHILASVSVGFLFRFYRGREDRNVGNIAAAAAPDTPGLSPVQIFVHAVQDGFSGIISICAFVIFFAVAVNLLMSTGLLSWAAQLVSVLTGIFGIGADGAQQLLTGLLEVTSGLWSLRDVGASFNAKMAMAAFMLGWAGVSVHCQVLSFMGNSGLSVRPYFIGKILHAVFSALFIYVLCRCFPVAVSTAEILTQQVNILSALSLRQALTLSATNAAAVTMLLALPSLCTPEEKRLEKPRRP